MQSQVHSTQAVQKTCRATRGRHLPCRYATISANDAKGTEYQSGEPREDSLTYSTSTRLSKIPVTVQKLMQEILKEQKEHQDTLCISTDSVHNEKTREKESGSVAEESVPDVLEARE